MGVGCIQSQTVNSSQPEVGLTYSLAIYSIYIIYKCRCFAHDSTVTSFSG